MEYSTGKEVAAITKLALNTLRNDRSKKQRLPFCKIGRADRYGKSDVITFMGPHRIGFETQELRDQ